MIDLAATFGAGLRRIAVKAKVAVLALSAAAALGFAQPAAAEPALWVVKDHDSTIYLFGTVHMLRPETVWRTARIDKALGESSEVWLEIAEDMEDPNLMAPLVQKYGLSFDRPLSSRLTPEQFARVGATAAAVGLPVEALEVFKPWLAGLTLSVAPLVKAGYDPNAGVDKLIMASAAADGKTLRGLETVAQQLGFFDAMSEEAQIDFLMQAVDEYEDATILLDSIAAAWAAGDVKKIETLMVDEMKREAPELYDVILTRRNADWTDQLQERLKGSGVSFVAVGAAHLAGPDSVQAMLKSRGIEVERLNPIETAGPRQKSRPERRRPARDRGADRLPPPFF